MRSISFALVLIWSLAACSGEATDEIPPEDDTVSGAEMPAGQPLALDSSHNVRVVEHGLLFEEGRYYARDSTGEKWVPSSHRYGAGDTAFFTPVVKGYGVADGKVAVSVGVTIRDADGMVISDSRGTKQVSRFPEEDASVASFAIPAVWLDSLADSHASPHYDIEYSLKDRITGKSIEGIYRIHIARH